MTTTTISAPRTLSSLTEFLDNYPTDGNYEWVDGTLLEMRATRQHDDIADFIADNFKLYIREYALDWVVKTTALIRTTTLQGKEQARKPDVSVISRQQWEQERRSYAALTDPIQLAVEVTSTNWDDDYLDKLEEYQRLGIAEYWIVDYLALGSRDFLGKPKQPAVLIFHLDEQQRYQNQLFRGSERIVSPTFPNLTLTATQILTA
ncbi:MAG: Uma2 family endonuclease [Thiotrichaceae bacterium]